ncbi:MAG: hypothetical protein JXA42_26420 [Anaerolineales bacterium]|nr:hypothetical protein [Anaerolineales bacterium]
MIFIGLDDTDTLESRGTGFLARFIAAELDSDFRILGVTRHQLLDDPRVPKTAKNSCAAINLAALSGNVDLEILFERVKRLMLDNFEPGSDPGLCVTSLVPPIVSTFGRKAQTMLVTQQEAQSIAAISNVQLIGLGGTNDGIIGALAAVGLAAGGNDGRYVQVGRSRELGGLVSISDLQSAGIPNVVTIKGQPVNSGLVQTDKIRPARRGGKPTAVVEWQGDHWFPLKLD